MTIEELRTLLDSAKFEAPGDTEILAEMVFNYLQQGWFLVDPENLKVPKHDLEVWKDNQVQGFIFDYFSDGSGDEFPYWYETPVINLPKHPQ